MKHIYTFGFIFLLCSTSFAQKAEFLKKCEADYKLELYKSLWDNCDSYLELDTMCARVYLLKAHALLNLYDQSWAVDDFKKCLELDPSNVEALFWVKLNDRWFLEDWEYYEIMKLDSSYYYPYLQMARKKLWEYRLDYNISFLDSVESLLDRAVELKPNDYASILERGEYFLLMKEYKLAEKDFNKAITIKPHEVVAYKVRGQALYYQSKFA
jgi:tetratricopeptide (TPR) repeat protein